MWNKISQSEAFSCAVVLIAILTLWYGAFALGV